MDLVAFLDDYINEVYLARAMLKRRAGSLLILVCGMSTVSR